MIRRLFPAASPPSAHGSGCGEPRPSVSTTGEELAQESIETEPSGLGVTPDLARCRLAARLNALFYAWWSFFVRLVEPDRTTEAITSRPLLLHVIATQVRHARQTTITAARSQASAVPAAKAVRAVAIFLRELAKNVAPLTDLQRWRLSARELFKFSFKGRHLHLRSPPGHAPGFLNFRWRKQGNPTPTSGFMLIDVSGSLSLSEPCRGAWRNYDIGA